MLENCRTRRMHWTAGLRFSFKSHVNGPPPVMRNVGLSDDVKPNWRSRILAWLAVILFLATIVLLFWFAPVIAAVIFVACVTFVAVAVGKAEGFWRGLKYFIKEILFGW